MTSPQRYHRRLFVQSSAHEAPYATESTPAVLPCPVRWNANSVESRHTEEHMTPCYRGRPCPPLQRLPQIDKLHSQAFARSQQLEARRSRLAQLLEQEADELQMQLGEKAIRRTGRDRAARGWATERSSRHVEPQRPPARLQTPRCHGWHGQARREVRDLRSWCSPQNRARERTMVAVALGMGGRL